ncbi:MAG: hypothetical protein RRE21_07590 [Desulfurococcales archaeon]|nr:hypothetical protein [Desulfurococcales archaeon]
MGGELMKAIEDERRRNLISLLEHAVWNAEAVKKLGKRWFEIRDRWLNEALMRDKELWADPRVREALLKALEVKSKLEKLKDDELERKLKTPR